MDNERDRAVSASLNEPCDELVGKRVADAQNASEIDLDVNLVASILDEGLSKLDAAWSGRERRPKVR